MTLTLCIDEHDRLSTPVHIQGLHSVEHGSLVIHTTVDSSPADLARALLQGLGFSPKSHGWPGRTERAKVLAAAWLHGYQIRKVVIYGAWRLRSPSLDWLKDLQASTQAAITLVTAQGFSNTDLLRQRCAVEQTLEDLLCSAMPPRSTPPEPVSSVRLQSPLPPLPAAPLTSFIGEAGAAVANHQDFIAILGTFERVFQRAQKALNRDAGHHSFCVLIEDLLAAAQTTNDMIIQVRAAEAAALTAGLAVELDLKEICRIAYGRHNTNPRYHDTSSVIDDRVDPRLSATAAVALASAASHETLAGLELSDFNPETGELLIASTTIQIPPALTIPVRAQYHRQQLQRRVYLLSISSKRRPAHAIRGELVHKVPAAAAAASRAQALRAYQQAITCHDLNEDHDTQATAIAAQRDKSLFPDSLEHWLDQLDGHLEDIALRYRLPTHAGRGDLDRHSPDRRGTETIEALSGVKPSTLPVSDYRRKDPEEDARRLHALLLQHGGPIKRSNLYFALEWSARRTQGALKQLERHLRTLGSVVVEEPPDYIILRALHDNQIDQALQTIRTREHAETGLRPRAAQLLRKTAHAHPMAFPALPSDDPKAGAQTELCQAGITWIYQRRLILRNDVAMTLGNHSRNTAFQAQTPVG